MADIYDAIIKRGQKYKLANDSTSTGAKAGDVVKITSVTAFGRPTDGSINDYEVIRVSNGKFTWRVSRSELEEI